MSSKEAAAASAATRTNTIAKNFAWYGLDVVMTIVGALVTTVAVARVIGPQELGYFNYIYWLTSVTGLVGSMGLPMTTFKYMGEFLGTGELGLAKAVFFNSLRLQSIFAAAISLVGLVLVFGFGDPHYHWISAFLAVSIFPQMVTFIPSQANAAAENMGINARAAIAGTAVNVVIVGVSLLIGWGLLGIAVSAAVYRIVELLGKLIPVLRRLSAVPRIELPDSIRKRMLSFSGKSTGMMLVQMIVWDRSDIVLLKALQGDIKQVAFFSVSFSVADKLLLLPQAFGAAVGASQVAEFGRDRENFFKMTSTALKYLTMSAGPVLLCAAALSDPLVRILYGKQYLPAIPVLALTAIFLIPKALLAPVSNLLYATEEVGFMLVWLTLCGAVDFGLDWLLIPSMGATGAALGNGIAQTLAAIGLWARAVQCFPLRLGAVNLCKLSATGIACALTARTFARTLPPVGALVASAVSCTLVLLVGVKLAGALEPGDRDRLMQLRRFLPAGTHSRFAKFVEFLVPPRIRS